MYPEDNTPREDALGPTQIQLPPADAELVARLLARFQPPPDQPWVWFTSPVTPDGPRTTYLAAYNPATGQGEGAVLRSAIPPDCPPYPWTGWGLLYPTREASPFGPWVGIPAQSAFHGWVSCFYQRVDIVPEAVYAEYHVGLEGAWPARTQTVVLLPHEATPEQIHAAEDARAWLQKWASLEIDHYEGLCREIEAKYWELSPLGRRPALQKTVANALVLDPRHVRRAWTKRRGKWPPRAQT